MNIGILGTGQISSAIVRGMMSAEKSLSVHFYLSPRNKEKSAALQKKYPQNVTVCQDNQQVLDNSQWVILALIPKDTEEILRPLKFIPEHKLLSLISDHSLTEIIEWAGEVEKAVHMVPLPFVELHTGPIAYYPFDEEIEELFTPLGKTIAIDSEETLNIIYTLTAMLSPFYLLLNKVAIWGNQRGLSEGSSAAFVTSLFEATALYAMRAKDCKALEFLCTDTTKGGLNESAYRWIDGHGGYDFWIQALDNVLKRLNKTDD